MKVLLLGSHLNYNLEHFVYLNLKKLEHDVEFYGYRDRIGRLANPVRMAISRSKFLRSMSGPFWFDKINEEIRRLAGELEPDIVLSIKGEVVKPETVEWIRNKLGAKTALWYPDDPRFFGSLVKYIAHCYDCVFTASEKAVEMYKEMGARDVRYLPFACEPTVHKKVELSEEERRLCSSDICFVGTYTAKRAKIAGTLRKAGLKVRVYGPYWKQIARNDWVRDGIYGVEMVKVFNAAEGVLNVHIEDDLEYKANMRTFEATGAGVFLLTDRPYGLERLFSIGKELVCFQDSRELVELAKYYLEHREERVGIAAEGQKRAYKDHTYEQRVREILSCVA